MLSFRTSVFGRAAKRLSSSVASTFSQFSPSAITATAAATSATATGLWMLSTLHADIQSIKEQIRADKADNKEQMRADKADIMTAITAAEGRLGTSLHNVNRRIDEMYKDSNQKQATAMPPVP